MSSATAESNIAETIKALNENTSALLRLAGLRAFHRRAAFRAYEKQGFTEEQAFALLVEDVRSGEV